MKKIRIKGKDDEIKDKRGLENNCFRDQLTYVMRIKDIYTL